MKSLPPEEPGSPEALSVKPSKYSTLARKGIVAARKQILAAGAILVISIAVGTVYSDSFDFLLEAIENLVESIREENFIGITTFIFLNNLKAAASALILGPAFGIVPILQASANGLLIGAIVHKTVALNGILTTVLGLLPHGIFEIPAMLIAWGLGIWLGLWPFKGTGPGFKERVKLAALAFLYYVVPLLLGASIIEGFLISIIK